MGNGASARAGGISNQTVLNLLERSLAQAREVEGQLRNSYEFVRTEAVKRSGELMQLRMKEKDLARSEGCARFAGRATQ